MDPDIVAVPGYGDQSPERARGKGLEILQLLIYFSSLIASYRFNHIRFHLSYREIANVTERVSEVRKDTCSNTYAWSEVGQIDAWK